MSRALVDILAKDKIITPQQHQEAVDANKVRGENFISFLINKKYLAEAKLLQYLSQKYGLPAINLMKYEINAEIIKLVPPEVARKSQVIPIQKNKGILVCAICDPTQLMMLEDIKFRTKSNVEAVLTTFGAMEAALNKYYTAATAMSEAVQVFQKSSDGKEFSDDINKNVAIQIDAGAATDKDAPVISLVNTILVECIRRNASDVHVESYEHTSRVRMRIDGVLQEIIQIPPEMKRPLIARMKIMSKLDISESRLPQDGRIKIKVGTGEVDFRVSTMPCLFGEKAVLRMLAKGNLNLNLKKLGFEDRQLEVFKKGIAAPNGMVLVTGPTGSGKTTTLYSALAEVNVVTDNLSTAEDPVEYTLEGINQVQVQKEIGLTFASVLRTLLRQDPDTILVGEIRDYETAEVAVQAALTGHLVLSTLH
ncbi:MAG: Flp pilus assembly complex ATPase component TadA, partial [Deltaproteobacteria bacterium]|nr:Flp pilus assembly complex ATPase component TadA [Deltaproteobacteria bacterium]